MLKERGTNVERSVPANLPKIRGDADALSRVVRNLVENAVKYGGDARWVGLRASVEDGGRTVRLEVRDRGPGIRSADRPHVFTPFYRGRGEATSGAPGSGLGLAIVKEIAEAHGGRVDVESPAGSGSVFVLRLPAVLEERA